EEYGEETVAGRTLVFASTNGSRAMLACAGAGVRLLGAFVNAAAVVESLAGRRFVLLACAGKEGRFALEDAACAGWLCSRLAARASRATARGSRRRSPRATERASARCSRARRTAGPCARSAGPSPATWSSARSWIA